MLSRLRGSGLTSGATEKLSPTGCPGAGYGSCPTTRTRTSSKGNVNARNTFDPVGRYRRPDASSPRRKSPIAATWSTTGSNAFAQPSSTSSGSGRAVTADHLRRLVGSEQGPRVAAKDLHESRLIAVVGRTIGELQLGDRVHSHRATVAAARPIRTTASPPIRPIRHRRQARTV